MEKDVCKQFCSYYKPGKGDYKCGTFAFLERNLTPRELRRAAEKASKKCDLSARGDIKDMVCNHCDFQSADCDFMQDPKAPPCGGYAILEHLLKEFQ